MINLTSKWTKKSILSKNLSRFFGGTAPFIQKCPLCATIFGEFKCGTFGATGV